MYRINLEVKRHKIVRISEPENSEPENLALKAIMDETNRRVENWCDIGEFVMIKVTPFCLVIPRAIISYVIYFATNAGNEAFVLPFLQW